MTTDAFIVTQRQQQRMDDACRFIREYQETEGISPTVRELGDHFGLASSSSAYALVRLMEKHGKIRTKRNCPRTITLTDSKNE